MPKKQNDSSWGKVASWYDALLEKDADTYQTKVILPNLMRVLDLKPGERVIDIACGQGFFTRACRETGATVAGADISAELITLAREQSAPELSFYVAPAHTLGFAKDAAYDTAIIVLAIQNIEQMDATFAEASRVLAPNGRLVLVLNHPAFRVLKHSSWGYDADTQEQYRRVDRYLSAEKVLVDMHPGQQNGEQTISYHRSLQDISKALRKNGFAIGRLEEWISHRSSEKGPRQKAEDTARKEIPLFMMLEAVKVDQSRA
ncbi:MAG: class I SAM-dependent methyltransferase [Candidatus Paceibacteria bacterium]